VEKLLAPALWLSVASTLREVASTPTLLQLSPHSLTSLISITTTEKVKVYSPLLVNWIGIYSPLFWEEREPLFILNQGRCSSLFLAWSTRGTDAACLHATARERPRHMVVIGGRPPPGPAGPLFGPNVHCLCEVVSGWAWNTVAWCLAPLVLRCLAPSSFFARINIGKRLLMVYSMYLCLWPAKWYTPNTCGTRLIVNAYVT
jgi:hypothetical protein